MARVQDEMKALSFQTHRLLVTCCHFCPHRIDGKWVPLGYLLQRSLGSPAHTPAMAQK